MDGITVGHVFMQIQKDNKIKFLDAWVPQWEYVNDIYTNKTIYAWCLPMSLPLLQEKGFTEGDTCVYVEKKI